jgi:hypothetical protein
MLHVEFLHYPVMRFEVLTAVKIKTVGFGVMTAWVSVR